MKKSDLLRWTLTDPSDVEHVLVPSNTYTFKWKRQDGQQFHRLELSKPLVIKGKGILKTINDHPELRYHPCPLVCEIRRDGQWVVLWRGILCGNDMKPNETASVCEYEITPKIDDSYRCVFEHWEKEHNVAEMPGMVTTKGPRFFPYEFHTVRPAGPAPGGASWSLFYTNTDDDDVSIYWREVRIQPCVGGGPQAPEGDGWQLLTNDCTVSGTSKYVRLPVPAVPVPAAVVLPGYCIDIDGVQTPFPPPIPQEVEMLTSGIDDDPPVIVGPRAVYKVNSLTDTTGVMFTVEHPRTGSTYAWSSSTPNAMITSGQGTGQVFVTVQGLPPSFTMSVVETPPCGDPSGTVTFTSKVYNNNAWDNAIVATLDRPQPEDILVVQEFADGDTITAELPFYLPNRPTRWEVEYNSLGGPAVTVVTTENRRLVFTDSSPVPGANIRVRYGYDEHAEFGVTPDVIWSAWRDITRVLIPGAETISGPTRLCPGQCAFFKVPHRSGVTHVWSVPEGWSITLQYNGAALVCAGETGGDVVLHSQPDNEAQWVLISGCSDDGPPYFWAFDDEAGENYTTGRYLLAVIDLMLKRSCTFPENQASVVSDFFQYHPLTPSGINYVSGLPNKLGRITIHPKGDVLHHHFSQYATKAPLSLRAALDMVRVVFNGWWAFHNGQLRIEHLSHYENPTVVDIRGKLGTKSWSYRKETLMRTEAFKWSEADFADFVALPVHYDLEGPEPRTMNPAVSDKVKDYTPGNVTTDLPFLQNAADEEVDRRGFVLLQNVATTADPDSASAIITACGSTEAIGTYPVVGEMSGHNVYQFNDGTYDWTIFWDTGLWAHAREDFFAVYYSSNDAQYPWEATWPNDYAYGPLPPPTIISGDQMTGGLQVELEAGAITGMMLPNAHLAWANLLRTYHKHGRMLSKGYMNGLFTEFFGRYRIKAENVSYPLCPNDLHDFDPAAAYRTHVGDGTVEEAELDFFQERITIDLSHLP